METEQNVDANSLLSELDRGLRSSKMGEECESIVGFPWLFTHYPFPILINSASIKLADVFRYSNSNFSRLLILKVIQESEKHLDKIISMDEFVRRLFSVTYSNDPIARSTTLRVLGSISCIITERKNIHHVIRTSLDAEDEVEASAAIEAAAAFAKNSVDFASSIYPKVLAMISKPDTSIEIKIQLLSILHHTHYNARVAADVRNACIQLAAQVKSDKFIQAVLHTLTHVANTSLFFIPEHISLLIKYLREDARKSVKISAIKELRLVSEGSPHLWSKENVNDLLDCLLKLKLSNATNISPISMVIPILVNLVKCPCLLTADPAFMANFHQELEKFCLSIHSDFTHFQKSLPEEKSLQLIANSFQLLVALSMQSEQVKSLTITLFEQYLSSIQSTKKETIEKPEKNRYQRLICISIVKICESDTKPSNRLVSCLEKLLFSKKTSIRWIGYISELFCSLTHLQTSNNFINKLGKLIVDNQAACDESILTQLCVLYFQTLARNDIKCPLNILDNIKGKSLWFFFRLARQAMRYGHHHISQQLCIALQNSASSETVHFWMLSLQKVSTAENLLINSTSNTELTNNLTEAIELYSQALSSLKAAGVGSNCLIFAGEYVRLRCKLLRAHALLRQSCNLMRTSPAPAIAVSSANSCRDDIMRCGSIVPQMRKCAKEFRTIADAYSLLYQTSFNADNETLSHLQLLQHSCTIVAEAIESIFQTNKLSSLFVNKDTHLESDRGRNALGASIEHKNLNFTCHEVSELIRAQLDDTKNSLNTSSSSSSSSSSTVDCNHISTLLLVSIKLLMVPLCIPRLFFQSVQRTCVKLALSPQPKSPGDVILTPSSASFALKVEGVVVDEQVNRVFRKVAKVMLNINSCMISKSSTASAHHDFGKLPLDTTTVTLQSTVTPHNDYFQEEFLLPLTAVGLYNITVEASTIDETDALWKTGPVVSLSTKVVEDPS